MDDCFCTRQIGKSFNRFFASYVTMPPHCKLKASFWTLVSSIYTQEEAAVPPSFHQTFLQQLAKAQRRLLFWPRFPSLSRILFSLYSCHKLRLKIVKVVRSKCTCYFCVKLHKMGLNWVGFILFQQSYKIISIYFISNLRHILPLFRMGIY